MTWLWARFAFVVGMALTALAAQADDMRLAVTTSFHNSGLSDVLLPAIKADLDLDVHLLVVGTGQALRLGRAGDVDAILVHSRTAEDRFVADGFGTHRREIMFNDFVLIGPDTDPAGVAATDSIVAALGAIAKTQAPFVSRGDDSGTHRREVSLWQGTGVDPATASPSWYRAAGAGMGATLNVAAGMVAYVFSDRASWLNFANKKGLEIVFQGDEALTNQYAFIAVAPDRHPHVKHGRAQSLETWLTAPKAQAMIGAYQIEGEQLFTPNATEVDGG